MIRRFFCGLAVAVTAGFVLTTHAGAQQTGTLNGYLKVAGTDVPVLNARVQVVNPDILVVTDERGYFTMERLPEGFYTLVIRAPGLQPKIVPALQVRAGAITEITIEIHRATPELEPVEVTARGNRDGRATGSTTVIRGADIPPDADLMSVLQGRLPGYRFSRSSRGRADEGGATGVTGRRVLWIVDGVPMRGSFEIGISVSEVDCIEVRRGAQSTLEFTRVTDEMYDAAILVWTIFNVRRVIGACAGLN
ncbi:MAG: carboxypeptidase regulatory-like domain-containing protein [Gemmatimonadetes bacterium]|nr:carboxypeptidase regulatory-like domain-containing protein [Gemmatimonadota bacterium]